jgi:hypothetical protein
MKKTRSKKSRDTVPLREQLSTFSSPCFRIKTVYNYGHWGASDQKPSCDDWTPYEPLSRYVKKKQAAETSSHTEATLAGECVFVYVCNCWRLLHDMI